jgi:hypothetical protein
MDHRNYPNEHYDSELEQLAEETKTERSLKGEDPDAPILFTKQQLMERRSRNIALNKGAEPAYGTPKEKFFNLLAKLLMLICLAGMLTGFLRTSYLLFGLSAGMLALALPERDTSGHSEIPFARSHYIKRAVCLLVSIGLLAAAVYKL